MSVRAATRDPISITQEGIGIKNGYGADEGLLGAIETGLAVPFYGIEATIENPIAALQVAAGAVLTVGGVVSGGTLSAAGAGLIAKGLPTLVGGTIDAVKEGTHDYSGESYVEQHSKPGVPSSASSPITSAGGVVGPIVPTVHPVSKPKTATPDPTPSTPASAGPGGTALALGAVGLAALKLLAII